MEELLGGQKDPYTRCNSEVGRGKEAGVCNSHSRLGILSIIKERIYFNRSVEFLAKNFTFIKGKIK